MAGNKEGVAPPLCLSYWMKVQAHVFHFILIIFNWTVTAIFDLRPGLAAVYWINSFRLHWTCETLFLFTAGDEYWV